jgi:hypothetical protein
MLQLQAVCAISIQTIKYQIVNIIIHTVVIVQN